MQANIDLFSKLGDFFNDGRWQFSREPIPYGLQITVFYGQPFQEMTNVYQ